jgi:hypothetical protein
MEYIEREAFTMKPEPILGPPIQFYNGTITLRFDKDAWKWYRVMEDGT